MKKILIVDDEFNIRLLISEILQEMQEENLEIYTAKDGIEAIDIAVKEKPNLIFLDIMMPGKSGYEVCNEIKNKYNLNQIYIIMLTAKGQEDDKKRAMQVGADMYITKPFDPDYIIEKTIEILNLNKF